MILEAPQLEKIKWCPDFKEDFAGNNLDPLASPLVSDFDFEEIDRLLGETRDSLKDDRDWTALIEAQKRIFLWLRGESPLKPGFDRIIGHRLIALMLVIAPDLFGGKSLRGVAMALGYTAPVLSNHSAHFTREFGIQNRRKGHDWRHRRKHGN